MPTTTILAPGTTGSYEVFTFHGNETVARKDEVVSPVKPGERISISSESVGKGICFVFVLKKPESERPDEVEVQSLLDDGAIIIVADS